MNKSKILIVEDEEKLAELLSDFLKQSNFITSVLHRGDEVEPWLESDAADLIILDLMLPGKGGIDVCKSLRRTSNIPIIMATARVEEIDRLLGLEIGADDYICKPYSPREVVARVKAVLRRSVNDKEFQVIQSEVEGNPVGHSLHLDENTYEAKLGKKTIELTKVEFNLLKKLAGQPGTIFSRDKLMDSIYDHQHVVNDRTIDSHIKKLRKKISILGIETGAIHSVYGIGYKFE